MSDINYYNLYQKFQKAFPIDTLESMTLEQYTDLNKADSFCYWIENRTRILGPFGGGSTYKFGIYRYHKAPAKNNLRIQSDDEYAWYSRYGADNRDDAFAIVKAAIIKIANAARNGQYEVIDDVSEFGNSYKWKIAFLYSDEKLVPCYQEKHLLHIAKAKGMVFKRGFNISDIQKFLISRQGNQNIYDYAKELQQLITADESNSFSPSDKEGIHYWWLTASPNIWSFTHMCVGEEQDYTLYNEKGNRRHIFQNFLDARAGDKVIGYESKPKKQIVSLAEISREHDGATIVFRKTEDLANPIDLVTLKDRPELANMQFIKNPNGSFFKLTQKEYDHLMDLIRLTNPATQSMNKKKQFTETDFLQEVFMTSKEYNRLNRLLRRKKNIILQGAPGVGKTFTAKRLAYAMMGEIDESRIEAVQFHQNYSYEDFIMGYKPGENGSFNLRHGIFYDFCLRAANDPNRDYFFIIDEINRGNLSKIFGELLQLIEVDYRDKPIHLAYNKDEIFSVPSNIHIIGMMNTADRSLAMIDYALRRRFSFFEMLPGFDTSGFETYRQQVSSPYLDKLIDAVKDVNRAILKDDSLGKGFLIGHSYLINNRLYNNTSPDTVFDVDMAESIIEFDLIPLVEEYWFDNETRLNSAKEKLRSVLQ